MKYLTKQEQTVLWVVLALLLTGLAVKTLRARHAPQTAPAPSAEDPARPHSALGDRGLYADAGF